MSEEQFLKLFKYIEAFRAEVNAKLDQKADKDRVYSALDYIIKQLSKYTTRNAYSQITNWTDMKPGSNSSL